jgi:hypothetical protein
MDEKVLMIKKYRKRIRVMELGQITIAEWTELLKEQKRVYRELGIERQTRQKKIHDFGCEYSEQNSIFADLAQELLAREQSQVEKGLNLRRRQSRIADQENALHMQFRGYEEKDSQLKEMEQTSVKFRKVLKELLNSG